MSDSNNLGVILSILNGIGLIVAGAITTFRSVATTNVRTLENRLTGVEEDLDDALGDLDLERDDYSELARWAHEARLEAAAGGVILSDIPKRAPRAPRKRTKEG
jgi:hypothetical protein